jgi:hypothetical protein
VVGWKLAQLGALTLACVAEELALFALIRQAQVLLDLREIDDSAADEPATPTHQNDRDPSRNCRQATRPVVTAFGAWQPLRGGRVKPPDSRRSPATVKLLPPAP